MKKNSPKKGDRKEKDKEFIKLREPKPEPFLDGLEVSKPIYFDKKQYSCKLPKRILDEVWEKGDRLNFKLRFDKDRNPFVEVEYLKNGIQ